MNRPFPILITALLVTSSLAVAAGMTAPSPTSPEYVPGGPEPDFLPMGLLADRYADEFPLEPAPAGLTPVEAARYWLHERDVHGRAPMAWVDWARATYDLELPEPTPAAGGDLAASVLRLYAAVGVPATPADRLGLEWAVASAPAALRAPLADLVAATAAAYERQAPLADAVLERLHTDGFDAHTRLVTADERDAMAANAADLLAALKLFHARAGPVFDAMPRGGPDAPIFADPLGLVVVGGAGDSTHASLTPLNSALPRDPVLIFDPSGNDVYTTRAGAACPDAVHLLHECNGLALSAVYDVDGADTYSYSGLPGVAQGAGSAGGLGMLVDVAGSDTYFTEFVRTTRSAFFNYIDGGAQGFAQGGFGLLLDGSGDDHRMIEIGSTQGRSIWAFGQGYGSAGSVGLALDLEGDDAWLGYGTIPVRGGGFQGYYTHGSGFYGGVGIIGDFGAGNDRYDNYVYAAGTTDYYAEGFGAFGGLGIQYEDGGDDDYSAVEKADAPFINPLLNCAYGTASYGGVGVFVDVAGNDRYFGDTISSRIASTMNEGFGGPGAAYGLFVDTGGDDLHIMEAHGAQGNMIMGRGILLNDDLSPAHNLVGTYLDVGGIDYYVGGGADNDIWIAGADINEPVDVL